MSLLVTICGRGNSKGIPRKNVRTINGKPLIAYSIEAAKKFAEKFSADIALSTDNEEIKNVAAQYGLATKYTRPADLATDTAGKKDTIADILRFEEAQKNRQYSYILDLDITSPLRNQNDLQAAFSILQEDKEAVNIFSVNHAARNPYFNMVEQRENGYYGLVKTGTFVTRQSAPQVYELNASFYFYRREYFNQPELTVINDRSLIYVMDHICFDLDHPNDFEFMEFLLANNKLDFQL
jgi:CMP-N,N'-diacetyllegionaminic acid synthase